MIERHGSSNLPEWKEVDRLAALQKFDILDTEPDVEFDSIAKIAAQICNAPIAYISFIDERRQWLKAKIGLDLTEVPRETSVCSQAMLQPGFSIVSDLTHDPRFRDLPLSTALPCRPFMPEHR